MEKKDVTDYIKSFVFENYDKIEGLTGNRTEKFTKQFNTVINENEDNIYSKMLEIRENIISEMLNLGDKINCDEDDFEHYLNDYTAYFLISRKDSDITYIGIFNDENLDYPKFDEETYSQFYSGVYIPFMM